MTKSTHNDQRAALDAPNTQPFSHPRFTPLAAGIVSRLVVATAVVTLLWITVYWALRS